MKLLARVHPGSRACCLMRPEGGNLCCGAKGPKTIDAPSSLIRMGLMQTIGGRTNSLRSDKAHREMRASDPRAGRQASDQKIRGDFQMRVSSENSSAHDDASPLD